MNPVKIAATVLVLGIILAASLVAGPFSFNKQSPKTETTEAPAKKQTENSFKNPLVWLEENSQTIIGEFSPPAITGELAKPLKESLPLQQQEQQQKQPPQEQPAQAAEEINNYYSELLNVQQLSGGFTDNEFAALKKDESGRPLFPEELFGLLKGGDNLNELKPSFMAWQRLAETYLVNLKKMTVEDNLQSTHQSLIDWVEYFIEVHKKLSRENLSEAEINNLISQYQQKAESELPKTQKIISLRQPTISAIVNRFLSLVFKAFAQEQTLTCDFGGPVRKWYDVCTNGVGIVLTPPPGKNFCGALFLDFLEIIKSYNYGYFGSGACILGKARRGPGICNQLGEVNYSIGSAVIMYFGSASSMNSCKIKTK